MDETGYAVMIGGQTIPDFVNENCDREFELPWPSGYTLLICNLQDTILTPRDYQFWRSLPQMEGDLQIIGTVGHKDHLAWDRKIAGINAQGKVFLYEIREQNYVVFAAESLEVLFQQGLRKDYFQDVARVIRQREHDLHIRQTRRSAESSEEGLQVTRVERGVVRRLDLKDAEVTEQMFVDGNMPSSLPSYLPR
ncbi:tegument protein UL26 [Saimiriine betaherpesvirus 4]|uniref:Tegument protein UL26 n=1 Tax=Saimiriine betaherpesvirus 4 TaxID=1535247 RepID=G8XSU0_9BETA|nr:tegument protein UL26 [Saimiriine betaherpesvirus 4]AEV80887.1 tegument protein UL26 [Saimiriine betaherpesvirus 4]